MTTERMTKRTIKRRWLLLPIGLCAAGTAWWLGGAARGGNASDSAGAGPVAAGPGEVVAPGLVEGRSEVIDLAFETAGRIAAVLVDEGAKVAEGQLLARLDDRLARAHVAQAEAGLAAARARRDLALRGSRLEEIRAAEAELDGARADARDRESTRSRTKQLLGVAAITQAEADRTESAYDGARARVAAAEAHLTLARRGARTEVKREALAGVGAAEAELEAARAVLAQYEMRAPQAGVILRRKAEPGEQVTMIPPTIVLTLVDADRLRLRTEIDEADVARVRVGQQAYVMAEAYGERRFPGKVISIARELGRKNVNSDDPRARFDTRVLEALVELEGTPAIPLGLRMDVHLP